MTPDETDGSVTEASIDAVEIRNCWLLYIDSDAASGDLTVGKYHIAKPASAAEGEAALLKMAIGGEKSNWANADGSYSSCIESLNFHGAGQFTIALGKKGWSFYNNNLPKHDAVEFKTSKVICEGGKPVTKPGTPNTSFRGGKTDTVNVGGKAIKVFRCSNRCYGADNKPLGDGITSPLIFDIQLEMQVAGAGKVLVVLDPGGGNTGPPGFP